MSDYTQLFRTARIDFRIFDSYDQKKVITRAAPRLPLVRWPDGTWCIEANLFVDKLVSEGFSLKGRGGTISTYMFYVCGFLRFIQHNKLTLHSLTDKHFSEHITSLYSEKKLSDGVASSARNRTTVRTMANVLLDFLEFTGKYYNIFDYVSEFGRIKAQKIQKKFKTSDGRNVTRLIWNHRSIGVDDPKNRRMPIGLKAFTALKDAPIETKNDFLRIRRNTTLSLLDETGMRRMEAVLLTVGDVQNSILDMYRDIESPSRLDNSVARMLGPHIFEFTTVKHKHISRRRVPIDAITLQYYESYLRKRKTRMRQLGLDASDPNLPFLISYTTGQALEANTITQELLILSKAAKLEVPCSPHLIRHLYIVRLFKRFLSAHKIENTDRFRRALIDTEGFKEKVRELTGHASVASLESYLELALDETSQLTSTMSNIQYQEMIDNLSTVNRRLIAELKLGLNPKFAFQQLSQAIQTASNASKSLTENLDNFFEK